MLPALRARPEPSERRMEPNNGAGLQKQTRLSVTERKAGYKPALQTPPATRPGKRNCARKLWSAGIWGHWSADYAWRSAGARGLPCA
jgi:hypothetical protein